MAVGVGNTLYGFCNGYFGRDSYGDKRIIAIGKEAGTRWVVVKEGQYIQLASGFSKEELEKWSDEREGLRDSGYSEEEIEERMRD